MSELKTPIEMFIIWLRQVKSNEFMENVSFLVLTWYPGNDSPKLSINKGADYTQTLIDVLTSIHDPMKVIGISLYVERAVSYVLKDALDSDGMLDQMLNAQYLADTSQDPDDKDAFLEMKSKEAVTFEQRKQIREAWDDFKDKFLSFDAIRLYQSSVNRERFGY